MSESIFAFAFDVLEQPFVWAAAITGVFLIAALLVAMLVDIFDRFLSRGGSVRD